MSTIVEFWQADNNGEALIRSHRCKVLDALAEAATSRPSHCVLVTLRDTRPLERETILWKRKDYTSSCIDTNQDGILNLWKEYI